MKMQEPRPISDYLRLKQILADLWMQAAQTGEKQKHLTIALRTEEIITLIEERGLTLRNGNFEKKE